MPKTYRPQWLIGKWLIVTKFLKVALSHLDEIETSEWEVEFIKKIVEDVEGKEQTNAFVDQLMSRASPVPDIGLPRFARDTDFSSYAELEDLQHRLWEHEEDYNRGRLPHDQHMELLEEIERREVRLREANPRPIRPPSANSDPEAG